MLKSLQVDNFKSLVNFTFEPKGLNLLIGRNNAGKTNLCQAMRFLSLTTQFGLDEAATFSTVEAWNLLNVYSSQKTISLSCVCDLSVAGEPLRFSYELSLISVRGPREPQGRPFEVKSEALRVSGGKFRDTILLKNDGGRVQLLHERRFLRDPKSETYVDTTAPTDATMLSRLYDLETNQRANIFKKYLASWEYYSLDPNRMRSRGARPLETVLEATGANLSSVLLTLHNAEPRAERKVIDAVRTVEPRLDLISFLTPDPEHVYMFFEDGRGNRFGVDSASDGTLRYLAFAYIIISNRQVPTESGGPPVVMIEEPENGIFVGHFKNLFERIEPSGSQGQFIFTSHNPYFIDQFEKALDGVFVVKPGETHSLLVRPDPEKLRERLGEFSLGDLHFRGLLE